MTMAVYSRFHGVWIVCARQSNRNSLWVSSSLQHTACDTIVQYYCVTGRTLADDAVDLIKRCLEPPMGEIRIMGVGTYMYSYM